MRSIPSSRPSWTTKELTDRMPSTWRTYSISPTQNLIHTSRRNFLMSTNSKGLLLTLSELSKVNISEVQKNSHTHFLILRIAKKIVTNIALRYPINRRKEKNNEIKSVCKVEQQSLSWPRWPRSPWQIPRWSWSARPAGCASAPGPAIGSPCGPSADTPASQPQKSFGFQVLPVCTLSCPRTFGKEDEGAERHHRFCSVFQNLRSGPLYRAPASMDGLNQFSNRLEKRFCKVRKVPEKGRIPVDEFLCCDSGHHRVASHILSNGNVRSVSWISVL